MDTKNTKGRKVGEVDFLDSNSVLSFRTLPSYHTLDPETFVGSTRSKDLDRISYDYTSRPDLDKVFANIKQALEQTEEATETTSKGKSATGLNGVDELESALATGDALKHLILDVEASADVLHALSIHPFLRNSLFRMVTGIKATVQPILPSLVLNDRKFKDPEGDFCNLAHPEDQDALLKAFEPSKVFGESSTQMSDWITSLKKASLSMHEQGSHRPQLPCYSTSKEYQTVVDTHRSRVLEHRNTLNKIKSYGNHLSPSLMSLIDGYQDRAEHRFKAVHQQSAYKYLTKEGYARMFSEIEGCDLNGEEPRALPGSTQETYINPHRYLRSVMQHVLPTSFSHMLLSSSK